MRETTTIDKATCRGCGLELIGKPFHLSDGTAYTPRTMKRCPVNHYGGFVCSEQCDREVSAGMLRSMPGCGDATGLDCYARKSLADNWR